MTVLYQHKRGKGWCIFHTQGARRKYIKSALGLFFLFFFKKNITAEISRTHLLQLWLKSVIAVKEFSEMHCTPYRTNTKASTLERGQSNQFSQVTELLWLMLYNSRQNDPAFNSKNDVKSEMEHTERGKRISRFYSIA